MAIEYSRLQKWAGTRLVSDSLLRELARDFSRQNAVIVQFQQADVQCDTVIVRQARVIQDWKDAQKKSEDLWTHSEQKRKRSRWVPYATALGGLIGGVILVK